ncbi:HD domain-containing protein [Thermus filiformis]|uniref:Phosphohydrolase n=1 Tax=Thermus filiformis TaxID=276 RepID=A0A0D6X9K9_THEFI|nr:HD domain-containing protein [Thermus filiformis]KIX84589.1 phosphohydrolase [Thermus filiformis]
MTNRLRRLLLAFFPRLARPDDAFALRFLEGEEAALYLAMDPRDRLHGVEVAKRLLEAYPEAPPVAVRAALLHDVGKSLRPYRPLERVLTGLFAPPVPIDPLRGGVLGAFQVRRHHPLYGARMVRDPQLARLIREHHAPKTEWGRRIHRLDREF